MLNIEYSYNLGGHGSRHKNDGTILKENEGNVINNTNNHDIDDDGNSNLAIHKPENASAMDESKALSRNDTNNISLEVQKKQLINGFIELVDTAETQEDLNIIKNSMSSLKPKLNAFYRKMNNSQDSRGIRGRGANSKPALVTS